MSKELEVRNLRVSFKTNNGTVKAVRDISFDVEKGETLCIVGESGSGKSVTAKAILGILAGNSIVEGGEIIYKGQNLLRYTEEDFNKIRGNKVTMIFQDPMSSLDPIMKIGHQLTEATILNGKTNKKNAKKEYKLKLKQLKDAMILAGVDSAKATASIDELNKMALTAGKLDASYTMAIEYEESLLMTLEQVAIDMVSPEAATISADAAEIIGKIANIEKYANENYFVFAERKADVFAKFAEVKSTAKVINTNSLTDLKNRLDELKAILEETSKQVEPNFFVMGYYINKESEDKLHGMDTTEMNSMLRKYVDDNFMLELLADIEKALKKQEETIRPFKAAVIDEIEKSLPVFEKDSLDKKESFATSKTLVEAVDKSINRLALYRNPDAYTFRSTMDAELNRYFTGIVNNPKELKRVEKDTVAYEKQLAKKGDAPKVVPAVLVDLELTKNTIVNALKNLSASYEAELKVDDQQDFAKLAVDMVDYIKELTYASVHVVTKQMAYDKAIRIMEDVGIKEPRKRFEQYPFEFSGGMRQRIVIAVALAANPDILICDEPTTALDVTIQAQILELINEVKKKRNISVIFITHDLGVVANMADKVAVMYAGKIVEYGTVREVFYEPAHPYTWALLASMPDLDTKEKLEAIPGTPPNMIYPPVGDAFADRNQYAMQIDFEKEPPKFKITDTHWAATWLLHKDAPKVEPPKSVTDRIARMKEMEANDNE